jgi:hypothetical protein
MSASNLAHLAFAKCNQEWWSELPNGVIPRPPARPPIDVAAVAAAPAVPAAVAAAPPVSAAVAAAPPVSASSQEEQDHVASDDHVATWWDEVFDQAKEAADDVEVE